MSFQDWFKKPSPTIRNSPGTDDGKPNVKRMSGFPMFLVLAAFCVFAFIIAYTLFEKANNTNVETKKNKPEVVSDATQNARDLVARYGDSGTVDAKGSVLPVPEQPRQKAQTPVVRDMPVFSLPFSPKTENPRSPEYAALEKRAEQMRQQMFESALRAKTSVDSIKNMPANRPQNDPARTYQERVRSVENRLGTSESGGSKNNGNDIAKYENNNWTLNRELQNPKMYSLQTGSIINATMISGINSDLPGQVIAQVSRDVYDSPTGKYKLIPQGTRLIGSYNASVAYGQDRLFMAWQRFIFPDGRTLDIQAMPGADKAGYAGFDDKVNHHYLRTFASAILLSGVVAGVSYSQNNTSSENSSDRQRFSDALSESLGQELGQVMTEMMRKNINIAPTIEIRPGYQFNVIVTKDISFEEPYQHFNY